MVALVLVAAVGTLASGWRAPIRRRVTGRWWDLAGAPLEAGLVRRTLVDTIWQLIRGANASLHPSRAVVARRYAEVLSDNVGQPGFRELLTVVTDLDTRQDVIVALVGEPFRRDFLASRPGRDRRIEVLDLARVGCDHALDMVAAALTPAVACDPALVAFSSESVWRGEVHRLCDRPAASHRLIEEVAAAGATQVIVVSAVGSSDGPHRLQTPRLDPRHRLGEFLVAAEGAALRDALEVARRRFEAVYFIRPAHLATGPFDFRGVYDEASDRRQPLAELIEQGYDDAYRQFIEPIVGASGEQIAGDETTGLRLGF
jgi:hypothetical protein